MLPKKRRIQRSSFSNIFSRGKRHNSTNLLLYVATSDKNEPSRFSFSVSKKVNKKAVDRNKLRRRGYSVVSRYLDKIKPNFLCLFSFKLGSGKIKFNELEKEIYSLLRSGGVLE